MVFAVIAFVWQTLLALTVADEVAQGTPIEKIPAEVVNNIEEFVASNPITKPLVEIGSLFADTGEAIIGLIEVILFLITPNPLNVTDFKALKRSLKFMLSIPLVQVAITLVLVGGGAVTILTNDVVLEKIIEFVDSLFVRGSESD